MLTPQEVSEKVFPKSSGFGNGYAMAQVDEFLDTLTEDYTALYKENVTLKAKLKILAERVEEYRATEDAMRSTLLTAQKMAAKLVQEAQTEKENLLKEAKEQHAAQLAQLEQDKQDAEEKLVMAKQSLAEFVRHGSELCAQQQEFLNSLPEMEGGILSYKDQLIKPEPEIYQLLLKRYGLKADESVFLDDTLVNVKAAEEQGIQGIHFLTKEQAEEELRKLGVDC